MKQPAGRWKPKSRAIHQLNERDPEPHDLDREFQLGQRHDVAVGNVDQHERKRHFEQDRIVYQRDRIFNQRDHRINDGNGGGNLFDLALILRHPLMFFFAFPDYIDNLDGDAVLQYDYKYGSSHYYYYYLGRSPRILRC